MARDLSAIYDALFERLAEQVDVEYSTREWEDWTSAAAKGRLPFLHLGVEGAAHQNAPNMPPVSILRASIGLLVKANTEHDETQQILALVRQVKAALRSQPDERGDEYHTTLGGLVEWAWVAREDIVEGHVSGVAGADVYVEMQAVEDD